MTDDEDSLSSIGDLYANKNEQKELSDCNIHYKNSDYSVKCLILMAIGQKTVTGDAPLIDMVSANSLWNKKKNKKDVKPSLREKMDEIVRRDEKVRCKNWNKTKCTDWLEANLIKNVADVAWLRQEAERFEVTFQAADKEVSAQPDAPWRGSVPYLRLIL
jgi:hypothetical protein